jgi:hypothetical protein
VIPLSYPPSERRILVCRFFAISRTFISENAIDFDDSYRIELRVYFEIVFVSISHIEECSNVRTGGCEQSATLMRFAARKMPGRCQSVS